MIEFVCLPAYVSGTWDKTFPYLVLWARSATTSWAGCFLTCPVSALFPYLAGVSSCCKWQGSTAAIPSAGISAASAQLIWFSLAPPLSADLVCMEGQRSPSCPIGVWFIGLHRFIKQIQNALGHVCCGKKCDVKNPGRWTSFILTRKAKSPGCQLSKHLTNLPSGKIKLKFLHWRT